MSKDNVKNMFAKFEKDADLKKKYVELMKYHQNETEKTLSDKLIELGKNSGFDFSKDDLLAARSEFMDIINSNSELADNDLSSVTGGKGDRKLICVMMSVFTLGTYCAIMSIDREINHRGGCAREITTSDPNCKNT